MKVILLETIKKVGKENQIVDVKEGYAWNFLIPKKKAILATTQNKESVKSEVEKKKVLKEAKQTKLEDTLKQLSIHQFNFFLKPKKDSKECYGSISHQKIVKEINRLFKTNFSIHIFPNKDKEILKLLGDHIVAVKIANKDINLKINIKPITEIIK
ncbi:50S ribosomal protein L9 [Mycoplasma sp. SG1]|uniref:50S ribosomal protein L9 n=1 Tax=Mycoplasma sp. SG1 TaxID=2810348 RepID=UPI0020252011|nr:50S ribosomal protein L9 [Mycoplasma sp. SG1]URM52866.1 50S ribosomal protein L9 [Mycoplasma sp. SG1]